MGQAIAFLIAVFALWAVGPASAQDNYEAGKKPADMFATDCGLCHKSPIGLAKAPGMFGLESFLREHYTASRAAANAIAGYLRTVNAEQQARPAKRRAGEAKPKAAKPGKGSPVESKPAESKPGEAKSGGADADVKTSAEKPAEPKAAEPKPADAKPIEPPAPPAAPAAKPDKSE